VGSRPLWELFVFSKLEVCGLLSFVRALCDKACEIEQPSDSDLEST